MKSTPPYHSSQNERVIKLCIYRARAKNNKGRRKVTLQAKRISTNQW